MTQHKSGRSHHSEMGQLKRLNRERCGWLKEGNLEKAIKAGLKMLGIFQKMSPELQSSPELKKPLKLKNFPELKNCKPESLLEVVKSFEKYNMTTADMSITNSTLVQDTQLLEADETDVYSDVPTERAPAALGNGVGMFLYGMIGEKLTNKLSEKWGWEYNKDSKKYDLLNLCIQWLCMEIGRIGVVAIYQAIVPEERYSLKDTALEAGGALPLAIVLPLIAKRLERAFSDGKPTFAKTISKIVASGIIPCAANGWSYGWGASVTFLGLHKFLPQPAVKCISFVAETVAGPAGYGLAKGITASKEWITACWNRRNGSAKAAEFPGEGAYVSADQPSPSQSLLSV